MRLDRFGRRRGRDDSGSRHKMPESLAPESQRGDDETRGKAGLRTAAAYSSRNPS